MTALRISSVSVLSVLFISLVLSVFSIGAASKETPAFDGEIVRLHVIANSNSRFDQELKLKVRDGILKTSKSFLIGTSDATDVFEKTKENIEIMKQEAIKILREEGTQYNAEVMADIFPFPAKTYGELTFPAGKYNAVRVVIGEGKGENWWCVMFPPLCFVNETKAEMPIASKDMLTEQTKDVLSGKKHKIKFKVMEFFR